MWCNGLTLEEWEEKATEEELVYLHGNCHLWVLRNFKDGDKAIIWNSYNDDLESVVIVHCFIERNGEYLDVRGITDNEDQVEEGFEDFYTYDVGKVVCNSKKEFVYWLDKIMGDDWRFVKNVEELTGGF